MSDLAHSFGEDLEIDTTGDVAIADGTDNDNQTFTHRLLTPLGGYIWSLPYGTGLPQMVGQTISLQEIQDLIAGQAALEATIDQTQPITVTPVQISTDAGNGVSVNITYTNLASGLVETFTLGE